MYHILSIHKLMGICFYFLAIMNNAAVNMYVQVFCVSIISLGHITIDRPNTELAFKKGDPGIKRFKTCCNRIY